MEIKIVLLVINLLFALFHFKEKNYKTSSFSFFISGMVTCKILTEL